MDYKGSKRAQQIEGLTFGKTGRGFGIIEFEDFYGTKCSVQKSSLAGLDCIWLGCDDANPQIMASVAIRLGLKPIEGGEKDNGWVPYDVPKEVVMTTRMHLTRAQVKALLPILKHFAKTGELPKGAARSCTVFSFFRALLRLFQAQW